MKSAVFLLFLCLSTSYSYSQATFNVGKLDSLISTLDANNKGMFSVRITKNGQVLYSRAIGYSKISGDKKIKATPDTKYRIGSITKIYTSVMIFQLIEKKKLSLTTPLADYFPQIPNAKSITIGNMLNHHSGIYDLTHDSNFHDWMRKPHTEQQLVDIIASGKPAFEPGTKGEYSNSNFVLLGYIIEKATGSTYESQLKKRICNRLGLQNTYLGKAIDPKANEASSYYFKDGRFEEKDETDMSVPGGAGAIVSNTSDLNIFIDALFSKKLISDSSLNIMTTISDGYGFGIFKMPFYDLYSFGYSGHIDGFVSLVGFFPNDTMTLSILSNGLNVDFNDIGIGMLSIYNNYPYTIPSYNTSSTKH